MNIHRLFKKPENKALDKLQFIINRQMLKALFICCILYLILELTILDSIGPTFAILLAITFIVPFIYLALIKSWIHPQKIALLSSLLIAIPIFDAWNSYGGYKGSVPLLMVPLLIYWLVTNRFNRVIIVGFVLLVCGLFLTKELLYPPSLKNLSGDQLLYWFIANLVIAVVVTGYFIDVLIKSHEEKEDKLSAANEELEKVNHLKNGLFAIIAHDLKGPINNMKSVVEILMDEQETEGQSKAILQLLSKRMDNTVNTLNEMLNWSKAQLHGVSIVKRKIKLRDFLQSLVDFKQGQADEKAITINLECDEHVYINTDENILHGIIRNLIGNSIKYSHRNSKISIDVVLSGNSKLIINVSDQGVGMSDEIVSSLFFPKHIKSYGTHKEEGVGLGMLIVKEYAEHLGVEINVASQVGEGTTIGIVFNENFVEKEDEIVFDKCSESNQN